jgi:probable phosphoglycerate mutase
VSGSVVIAISFRLRRGRDTNLPIVTTGTLAWVYLARHGETTWSRSGQHKGLTDLALTPRGERAVQWLRNRLDGQEFAQVFTSPLQRAVRTCELAGFGAQAEVDRDLVEWDYGDYEGLTTVEIHAARADWQLFRDGCPGGSRPVLRARHGKSVRARL